MSGDIGRHLGRQYPYSPMPEQSKLVAPDDLTHYMQKCSELARRLEQAEQRQAEALRYLASYCDSGDPDPRADDGEEITNQDAYVLSAISTLQPPDRNSGHSPEEVEEGAGPGGR